MTDSPLSSVSLTAESSPGFFDLLFPPQAMLLVLLLLVTLPVGLLTGESLFMPLIEWIRSLFVSSDSVSFIPLPSYFFIKLGLFLLLCFLGGIQLILRINTIYYGVWSLSLPRPHPLHAAYRPDAQLSALALLNWSVYRTLHLFLPPVLMAGLTISLGALELYLLNVVSQIPLGMPVHLIFGTFFLLMFGILSGLTVLRSIWVLIVTLFGDIIAVTEPDLPVRTIMSRCRRLAFMTPAVLALYPASVMFCLAVVAACIWLLMQYDIEDLVHLRINIIGLFGVELVVFSIFLLLNYWNLSAYHRALSTYYTRLPISFKERFSGAA